MLRRGAGPTWALPSRNVEIMSPVVYVDTMWKLSTNEKHWHLRKFLSSGTLCYTRDNDKDDGDKDDGEDDDASIWNRYFVFTLDTRLSRVHD